MEQHREQFPTRELCDTLEVSVSGYYDRRSREPSARERFNALLLEQIRSLHQQSRRCYGSPRMTAELREQGHRVGENRVARLMKQEGIRARHRRKYKPCTDSGHAWPVAENALNRCFTSPSPDQAWVADITYIATGEGWMYVAVIMDLYSRRIVGWATDQRMTRELTLAALRMAVVQRAPQPGLVHHSDQGSQYACTDYQMMLKRYGITCSMSRKGNCYDNAAMESFFSSLKREWIFGRTYDTREEATKAIFEYIEVFYNRQRRHSTLGQLSPEAFERREKVR